MADASTERGNSCPQLSIRHLAALLRDLGDSQHGVVARSQLLDAGFSPDTIRHRLRTGGLIRLHRGVYAVGHSVLTPYSKWMAAVLAAGVGAVLSHRSAAALWGVRAGGTWTIEVTSPHRARRGSSLCCYSNSVEPDEVTVIDNIPTTGISRTLFDLAALGNRVFEPALRHAEFRRLTDTVTLGQLLERYPCRRGAPVIRAALGAGHFGATRTRSSLEDDFLAFLDARGLPRPAVNTLIEAGGRAYEADCAWRKSRLIAELDDPHSHGTETAFESDRARDRALLLAGWNTIRITPGQLRSEPDELERDLRALLGLPA